MANCHCPDAYANGGGPVHAHKTLQFSQEVEKTRLAFTCEDCLHFDGDGDRGPECGVFFPTDPHRAQRYSETAEDGRLYFCKMFEAL